MATIFPSSMPYDDVEIIDKSQYTEETVTEAPYIPSGPVAFIPFISPRGYGEDNKLTYMNASQLNKYGDPNLKKYGLSLYLAKRFVEGGGTVLGMRLSDSFKTAFTAVAAQTSTKTTIDVNIVNDIYYPVFNMGGKSIIFKEITAANATPNEDDIFIQFAGNAVKTSFKSFTKDDNDGKFELTPIENSIEKDKIEITYHAAPVESPVLANKITFELAANEETALTLNSSEKFVVNYLEYNDAALDAGVMFDDIKAKAEATNTKYGDTTVSDANVYPLFVIASRSAGKFANAFRFRITPDYTQNSYIDMTGDDAFCYKFIDSDNNNKLDEPFTFSFNDEYMYNGKSMCVDDVFESCSKNIVMTKLSGFDKFIEAVEKAVCIDESTSEQDATKFAGGINKLDFLFGTNAPSKFVVDLSNLNLSSELGIALKNGADPDTKFTWASDPFAKELAAAYNGDKSDLIFDQIRYPFQYVFCPSMDNTVIESVHKLVNENRKMTRASYFVADTNVNTGVPKDYDRARAIVGQALSSMTWKEDITSEWARVTDPYMGRKVYMPSVYFTAFTYPDHWIKRKGRPLAGRTNAVWSGFDVGTVTPASSNTNQYVLNHNACINTMCEDGLGNAVLYEQITAQKETSRLSEINNSQVLCDMVRIALKVANDSRWSDLPDDEINAYKTKVETAISDELSGSYQSVSITATRESVNGAGRNRILCAINVLFKDMLKGVTYKFYILAQ